MKRCCKITERFQAVGQRWIAFALTLQWIGRRGETTVGIWAHDQGIGITGDDFTAIDHVDNRLAGLAFRNPWLAARVARFIINDWLTGWSPSPSRQTHFFLSQSVVVSACALGQDH
ncbi:hypothetical protein D3C79_946170 [compost metagenome]